MVIARGVEGELGIMANHVPLVTPLKIAPIRMKLEGDKEMLIAISGGFMEVRGDKVTILAETAELPEDIDVERAKAAKSRAEQRLSGNSAEVDRKRAEFALQRALVRLQVSSKEPKL